MFVSNLRLIITAVMAIMAIFILIGRLDGRILIPVFVTYLILILILRRSGSKS